jgi:hypothetical protein
MARPKKTKSYTKRAARPLAKKRRPTMVRPSRFILPWPYIILILLCVGVLLIGWTLQAAADNLTVSAQLHAPLPASPANITSPADGSHFSSVPITVSGTCPQDSYLKLYRNDLFSGTAICTNSGDFQLQTDLFPGANHLKAQVYNITDDPGPAGNIITVYYDVPQQPTNPLQQSITSNGNPPKNSQPATSSAQSAQPFEIQSDYNYRGYKVGQDITWQFEISGGKAPYAINVDWGDGTNSVVSQNGAGKYNLSHRYKSVGREAQSSYTIKVSGSDSDGRQTSLQMFLVVNPGLLGFVANTLPSPHVSNKWLLVAWPAYAVVFLMAVSFWLGEREELLILKRRGNLRGRRV